MLGLFSLVWLALASTAAPKPYSIDLAVVVNHTTCPTVIDYDEDEARVPRVIKVIKCVPDPDEVCARTRPSEECCQHELSDKSLAKCVELTDTVLVSTADLGQEYSLRVPVGCACVVQQPTRALDA